MYFIVYLYEIDLTFNLECYLVPHIDQVSFRVGVQMKLSEVLACFKLRSGYPS